MRTARSIWRPPLQVLLNLALAASLVLPDLARSHATPPELGLRELEAAAGREPADPRRAFARGMLLLLDGRARKGASALEAAAVPLERGRDPDAARAWEAAAYGWGLQGIYANAERDARRALADPASGLTVRERALLEEHVATWRLLAALPPPFVEGAPRGRLRSYANPLGLLMTDAAVDERAVRTFWDSGNDALTMSESLASCLSLEELPGTAVGSGGGGDRFRTRFAVARTVRVGNLRFHRMPVQIVPDALVTFGPAPGTRIDMLLSWPMMRAMRRLTVDRDGTVSMGSRPAGRPSVVARLVEQRGLPVVVGSRAGHEVDLLLDTGADRSHVAAEYFLRHPGERRVIAGNAVARGVGGGSLRQDLVAPFAFDVRRGELVLDEVTTDPLSSDVPARRQDGRLGRDAFAPFRSTTIDMGSMTLEFRR